MQDNINLSNNWYIYHNKDNKWSRDTFVKIYEITDSSSFWKLYNNMDKLNFLSTKHLFLMKNDNIPLWEEECNKNGGCWSYKVNEVYALKLWEDLSIYMVCEQLSSVSDDIIGLSMCIKKNNFCVIKIWSSDSKNNSLKLLNNDILKRWGLNVIYISHII